MELKKEKELKDLMEKSFQLGYEAFPRLECAPILNEEFMKMLFKFEETSTKAYEVRIYLMKSYIKGWSQANLEKEWKIKQDKQYK